MIPRTLKRAYDWDGPAKCPSCKVGRTMRFEKDLYKCLSCGNLYRIPTTGAEK